jgi:hypothetical protein
VTDKALKTLVKLKELRWVELSEADVTDAAVEALREARPDLDVRL